MLEELIRELRIGGGVALDALANAIRFPAREPIHCLGERGRRGGKLPSGSFRPRAEFESRERDPPLISRGDHLWSPAYNRGVGRVARGADPSAPDVQRIANCGEPQCSHLVTYRRAIGPPFSEHLSPGVAVNVN